MEEDRQTIGDIAKALGVSKTTVSRAISGKGRIGSETKKRIQSYIMEHHYRPNVIARGLAQQKTYNIAVVLPEDYEIVELPFFQKCLTGMSQAAGELGYDILISMIPSENITNLQRIIENRKVDGVVLTRILVEDISAQYLKKTGIPFVAIGSTDDPEIKWIDNDHLEACRELTGLLLAKGMHRLALIGGSRAHLVSKVRYQGFVAAHADAGLMPDPAMIFMDTGIEISISDAIEHIMLRQTDAVICMDDAITKEVLAVCRNRHIRIPQDLKLASFYNSSILENRQITITGLLFDDRALGAAAIHTLMNTIDHQKATNRLMKNYQVIFGESTL